ncbi:uncharacterized protein LOC144447398 [Glandiceps talaboti]
MASQLTKYRCRKCRQFLFDNVCVIPSHGALGYCIREDKCTLWYLNDENKESLPDWIQLQINEGNWTKGKIHCPKCHGRLGSYDYLGVNKCPCGVNNTPNIQILRSRVDASKKSLSSSEVDIVLPRKQRTLKMVTDADNDLNDLILSAMNDSLLFDSGSCMEFEHERNAAVMLGVVKTAAITYTTAQTDADTYSTIYSDSFRLPSYHSDEAPQAHNDFNNYDEAPQAHNEFNSYDEAPPAHNDFNNYDEYGQEEQHYSRHSVAASTAAPESRTHKSVLRQADPSINILNFVMKDSSTQTEEDIECVQNSIVTQDRETLSDFLTDTELQEFQELWESLEFSDDNSMSVNIYGNDSNSMQTNIMVQTTLTAIPTLNTSIGGEPSDELEREQRSEPERRQISRRERNRRRHDRRRARKRFRVLNPNSNTYSVLQQDSNVQSESDTESETDTSHIDSHCCPVCLDVFFKPHICQPCNHIFCDPCLRQLAQNNPLTTPCPLCRNIIRHVKLCKDLGKEVQTLYPEEYVARRKAERRTLNNSYPLPGSPERGFWSSLLFVEPPPVNQRSAMAFSQFGASAMTMPSPDQREYAMHAFYDVPRGLTLLGVTLWMGMCVFIVFVGYAIVVVTSNS